PLTSQEAEIQQSTEKKKKMFANAGFSFSAYPSSPSS
uniref:Uncharacterized protein n=1 Tax=Aegilops tauschii subsp. strangulata TaxID=200361 RepID=A0A453A5S5_AEGTS